MASKDDASRRIAEIPGVGLLTATAAVATMGDAKVFDSGREFAAWLGLVPRQTGTGGRIRLLGISKRGDTYLRTLLIHGARAVMLHSKDSAGGQSALRSDDRGTLRLSRMQTRWHVRCGPCWRTSARTNRCSYALAAWRYFSSARARSIARCVLIRSACPSTDVAIRSLLPPHHGPVDRSR